MARCQLIHLFCDLLDIRFVMQLYKKAAHLEIQL